MKFSEFCKFFEKLESTTLRLEMTKILAELFKTLSVDEVKEATYILTGRLGPLYQKQEFGLAEKTVISAILQGLGLDKKTFEQVYKEKGDLGTVVEALKQQRVSLYSYDPDILQMYKELEKVAKLQGPGSLTLKKQIIARLIRELDSVSAKYVVRFVLGRMRLGFSDMTLLDALSWCVVGDKSLRPILEKAYQVRPDLGLLAILVKKGELETIKKIEPEVFVPIIMMRAERVSRVEEILEKMPECIIEPKYDGFRLQIHYKKGEVKLFSRNLEDVTFMYPDLVEGVKKQVKAESMIFEGEAIGYDFDTDSFLPFQETVQRRRKYDIEAVAKRIPLKLFVFELLYFNGKNLINEPFEKRRKQLEALVEITGDMEKDSLFLTEEVRTSDPKTIEIYFEKYISEGLEGLMAKKPDGVYKPGVREWNWIKFKRSYSKKLEDTLDVLVMGYYFGKGKRSEFGIGALLVGVYDKEKDEFVTVAKIGTGLSDDQWREMKKICDQYRSNTKPAIYNVDKQLYADVWVKPQIVIEVKADEITRSPVHTAGRKMRPTKTGQGEEVDIPGFALRFPRMIRLREDKRPEEVTTLAEMEQMYKTQY